MLSRFRYFLPLKKILILFSHALPQKVWEYLELTKEELDGHLLKETFPFLETIGYKQLIKDIFTEENPPQLTLHYTMTLEK